MADGAAPRKDSENITVKRSPDSGSIMYDALKRSGVNHNNAMQGWLDAVQAQAEQADAVYAAGMEAVASNMRMLYGAWGIKIPEPPSITAASPTAAWFRGLHALQSSSLNALNNSSFYSDPHYAKLLWDLGKAQPEDKEVNERLNDRFFTHNSTQSQDKNAGSLNLAQSSDIQAQFNNPDKTKWPNLILTSSHALVRDHKDVSDVMKGFHAMITQAYGSGIDNDRGKPLPLIRTLHNVSSVVDTAKGKPTIMLSAVYNDKNALVNGGTLLLRMHRLAEIGKKYTRLNPSNHERAEMERDYLGDDNKGTQMSHASINLGKLILSLIVKEPEKLGAVNAPDNPEFYRKPLIEYDPPLQLRDDADQVLQHIKLAGYSKGGTIVTDALRFLMLQLEHPNAQGKTSFEINRGDHYTAVNHADITCMMTHMGVLCVNPGINPLSRREQDLGIRRMSVRNEHDLVTSHLFANYAHDKTSRIKEDASGDYDNIYVVNGSKDNLGHGIEDALGSRNKPGYIMNIGGESGEDEQVKMEVKSRLQSFFASCYNKMGLSKIKLDVIDEACTLNVELSTGVTFEQFEKSARPNIIQDVLKEAGFKDISMRHDDAQLSPYKGLITFQAPTGLEQSAIAAKCAAALNTLNQHPDHGIFISQTSLNQLSNQPTVAVDTSDATHRGTAATARQRA